MTVVWLALSSFPALGADAWQQPPQAILEVLNAPDNPDVRTSPDGSHLLLTTAVRYPPLADRAAAMIPLAGIRVDGRTGAAHGRYGSTDPKILRVSDGHEVALDVGAARVLDVLWSADGERLALSLLTEDHVGLWLGTVEGVGGVVPDVSLVTLLTGGAGWLPDQDHLLMTRVPDGRGAPPAPPPIPSAPMIRTGDGDVATSTYEARDVLQTAHDEALFVHFTTSRISVIDARTLEVTDLGPPALYTGVSPSPDGRYLLVEQVRPPFSHRHAWWRFPQDVDVWTIGGEVVHQVASLPLADAVPIQGTETGPRGVAWRPTAKATLTWIEALDGGDWSVEVPHRDKLMSHAAPFKGGPKEVYRSVHRLEERWWGADKGTLVVSTFERARRWTHVWKVDVDRGRAEPWYDLSRNDRYNSPGSPVMRRRPDGTVVMAQLGDDLFFSGAGASPQGDRPFLDRRSLRTGEVVRLWRSDPDRYESFMAFVGEPGTQFLTRQESPSEPPNTWTTTLGGSVKAEPGEATRAHGDVAVTSFPDPVPVLQKIRTRIVTYERADGVPLSFELMLPPDYQEGTALPTVVYAYPREYSDPATAGQVSGSEQSYNRFYGPSHLFFLLQGYAVLDNTRMPVLGDPDTMYDTFVEQLVAGAAAAIDEAVELGVTDRDRVGVIGHSHGGLMTATLLAHSDLFRAGIARSGSYNHTIRPFGFQSERRTLWEAPETYLHLSPIMHAPKIDEPLLIIHGAMDENPGTIPFQSDRLFEAVRGTGGTVRLLMLPFEGHGYQARESVEHTLWEQLTWFDTHVKAPRPVSAAARSR